MTSILAHYQELTLKNRNRSWFVHQLVRNLHMALTRLSVRDIRTPSGRIEVILRRAATVDEVRERMSRVFGLANYSFVTHVLLDLEGMARAVVQGLPSEDVASFRIRVRRADPRFPVPSPDLARELGARVQAARGWKVDLDHAALVIGLEIVPGDAFFYLGKEPGPGGLPTGTAGRVVALLSGGIDSPVAAWRMMRRGC